MANTVRATLLSAVAATGNGTAVDVGMRFVNSLQVVFTGSPTVVKVTLYGLVNGAVYTTLATFDTAAGLVTGGIVVPAQIMVRDVYASLDTLTAGTTPAVTAYAVCSDEASGNATAGGNASESTLRTMLLGATLTDASIASAAGSSETVAAASTSRRVLMIANPATTSWWINPSGAAAVANGAGSFELPPGAAWTPRVPPLNIVKGIGTTASKLTVVTG